MNDCLVAEVMAMMGRRRRRWARRIARSDGGLIDKKRFPVVTVDVGALSDDGLFFFLCGRYQPQTCKANSFTRSGHSWDY